MYITHTYSLYGNKSQRIPKRNSKIDNSEKLATQGKQDEGKQNKNTICVEHHYTQTNTNNVNKTNTLSEIFGKYQTMMNMYHNVPSVK